MRNGCHSVLYLESKIVFWWHSLYISLIKSYIDVSIMLGLSYDKVKVKWKKCNLPGSITVYIDNSSASQRITSFSRGLIHVTHHD